MSTSPLPPTRLPPFSSLRQHIPLPPLLPLLPTPPPAPLLQEQPCPILPPVQSLHLGAPSSRAHHPTADNHDALISHIRSHAVPPSSASSAAGAPESSFSSRERVMTYIHVDRQREGRRPFQCTVCEYWFIKKDHAVKHVRGVHLKERRHRCTSCDRRFGQRSDLSKHVRSVHLGIKPYACGLCGMHFSHRGNQVRHEQTVHEKKKPFACTLCGSIFAEKSNLAKHLRAMHNAPQSSSSPKSSTQH